MPRNPDELGALWSKKSNGGAEFMTGTINGVKVVVFKNRNKTEDKHPDWHVLKAKPREEGAEPRPARAPHNANATQLDDF